MQLTKYCFQSAERAENNSIILHALTMQTSKKDLYEFVEIMQCPDLLNTTNFKLLHQSYSSSNQIEVEHRILITR